MTIFFATLVLIGVLYILAIITEEYFVPAIDKLARAMHLSSDAAGATLLAMGSSAPEFFTAAIAVFGLAGAKADVGAGTIVGSAMFNVLVIVGLAAMFKAVKLQWQPVMRDLVFYVLTVLLLLVFFWDGKIVLYEAVTCVILYVLYIILAVKWRTIFKYKDQKKEPANDNDNENPLHLATHHLIGWIIPDVQRRPRLYGLTFMLSIIAIGALSWLLVDRAVVIAGILNINPTFVALTVLAAGTSVPDAMGSVVVARQGRGDMAVSNAIGSNIFDILICLGLPWLLYLGLHGGSVAVGRENLIASVLLLLGTVAAVLFLLIVRNWRIGHKSGLVLIGLYVAYCVYVYVTVAKT